jgi:hypothetical protein
MVQTYRNLSDYMFRRLLPLVPVTIFTTDLTTRTGISQSSHSHNYAAIKPLMHFQVRLEALARKKLSKRMPVCLKPFPLLPMCLRIRKGYCCHSPNLRSYTVSSDVEFLLSLSSTLSNAPGSSESFSLLLPTYKSIIVGNFHP